MDIEQNMQAIINADEYQSLTEEQRKAALDVLSKIQCNLLKIKLRSSVTLKSSIM